MCGRYRLTAKQRYLRDHFGPEEDPAWEPRWNIAPTQQVATIRQHPVEPIRIFGLMRWGLIPYVLGQRPIVWSENHQRDVGNRSGETGLP
jgi:putative SOS response-associated peptidase YedK